ncbi:MAG: NAD(P)H-dependent oxidoreductase subunit E [Deltaproteobacteria bacterium]|nr:NAD(P)H-dependent oxidoreductase subunit E [Deltaproteobacteria bacterium]
MSLEFSAESKERIAALLQKYPTKMAATLPVLWIAQEQFGWVSEDAVRLVAATLEVPESHVHGVATFYTMYNKKPVGRLHIQVCTNISCMLCGSDGTLEAFEKRCGLKAGQTNEDFTLQEVECLAACGTAPAVQINDKYYEPVQADDVPALVDRLLAETKEGA